MAKLIGLSLSGCVRDILEGSVKIDDVAKIISATAFFTDDDWQEGLDTYCKTYWKKFTLVRIIEVMADVRDRIEQPRLQNDNHFPHLMRTGRRWVERESDIVWDDDPDDE